MHIKQYRIRTLCIYSSIEYGHFAYEAVQNKDTLHIKQYIISTLRYKAVHNKDTFHRFLIVNCLFSALYAKYLYYLVLYMQSVLIN